LVEGSISQTFDSLIGQSYEISFSLKSNEDLITPVTIDLTFGGSTYHAVIPAGPGFVWHDYSTTLPATLASSTLKFASINGGHNGPFLDDVRVYASPVPEPSTYLAGLSALGMLGLFGWRNRK